MEVIGASGRVGAGEETLQSGVKIETISEGGLQDVSADIRATAGRFIQRSLR